MAEGKRQRHARRAAIAVAVETDQAALERQASGASMRTRMNAGLSRFARPGVLLLGTVLMGCHDGSADSSELAPGCEYQMKLPSP